MYKLMEPNPPWKEFYEMFSKVTFSALHCLIYVLMSFVIYQANWNLLDLQMIQILLTIMTAQLYYVALLTKLRN